MIDTQALAVAAPAVPHPRRSWRRFGRHFAEMMLAMALGMAVLGGLADVALAAFGTGLSHGSVAVMALVMAFTMTVPMVAWMHYGHRMPAGRSLEMAASMVVPTFAAIALDAAGAISDHGVLLVQHALMVPAMLGVMLWRFDAYSH